MENMLLIGLSRQMTLERQMDVVSNNMANVNTNGFKADKSLFQEYMMPVAREDTFIGNDRRISYVQDRAAYHDFATELAQRSGPALAAVKRAVLRGSSLPLGEGLRVEADQFLATMLTDEGEQTMAEYVATTRPVAGVLMLSGTLALDLLGVDAWPSRVPAQIHYTVADPFRNDRAINSVYEGFGELPVLSLKGHIGHTGAASGAMGAIVAIDALRHGRLPNVAGTRDVDPEVAFRVVTQEPIEVDARVVQLNAFGFGGQDSSMVLREVAG